MKCPICGEPLRFRIEANRYAVFLGHTAEDHVVEVSIPLKQDDRKKVFYLLQKDDKSVLLNQYAPELIKKWREGFLKRKITSSELVQAGEFQMKEIRNPEDTARELVDFVVNNPGCEIFYNEKCLIAKEVAELVASRCADISLIPAFFMPEKIVLAKKKGDGITREEIDKLPQLKKFLESLGNSFQTKTRGVEHDKDC